MSIHAKSILIAFSVAAALGENAPLHVLVSPASLAKSDEVRLEVRNQSAKTIKAFSVRLSCKSGGTSRTIVNVLGLDPAAPNELAPGQTRFETARNCAFGPETPAPEADYVLFTDGTRWGPDRKGASAKIDGVIQGFRAGFTAGSKKPSPAAPAN